MTRIAHTCDECHETFYTSTAYKGSTKYCKQCKSKTLAYECNCCWEVFEVPITYKGCTAFCYVCKQVFQEEKRLKQIPQDKLVEYTCNECGETF